VTADEIAELERVNEEAADWLAAEDILTRPVQDLRPPTN
jgi:hypothetical protein